MSPEYLPLTLFIDDYTYKENYCGFKGYIIKKNITADSEEYNLEIINDSEYFENMEDLSETCSDISKNNKGYKNPYVITATNFIETEGRYIKKPIKGSQGQGIQVIDNVYDCFIKKDQIILPKDYIFQKEIVPKLIDGYKFDIRYFAVLVVKKNSIEIKHSPNAMVRLCSKKFSLNTNNLYSNLTNTSLNKDSECTISIHKNSKEWYEYFLEMEKITNNFFETCIDRLGEDYFYKINEDSIASTRIFGCDFIISEDDKVFMLEMNYYPGDNTYYGNECKTEVIKYYSEIIKELM